jgi:cation/acetate symporter
MIPFIFTMVLTLLITVWAARRGAERAAMYCASSTLTSTQNGLAIAGDFLSANTLLGMVALYFADGVDASIYYCSPLLGLYLMLKFVAGPLRRLGRFTLADVIHGRFPDERLRRLLGVACILISLIYLVAQLVGAGALMSILFGMSFDTGAIVVGALTTIYVVFGGMLATTWVQIVKATLLLLVIAWISVLAVSKGGGVEALYARVGEVAASDLLRFGGMHLGVYSTLSLIMSLTLGMLGLPHLLVRLFTVPDERTARNSISMAAGVIFVSFALMFTIISPAAVAFVKDAAQFHDSRGAILGGPNMITLHLTSALGGRTLFGIASAVTFSTILAVIAGLTVTTATAFSHDICATTRWLRPRDERGELVRFRMAALLSTAVGVGLAILFQRENLAFLVAMAFSVAASTTFPMLILTLYWRRLTADGAVAGGWAGVIASITLIVVSPACWVKTFGFPTALFPSDYPALVSVPLAFLAAWWVSRHESDSLVRV